MKRKQAKKATGRKRKTANPSRKRVEIKAVETEIVDAVVLLLCKRFPESKLRAVCADQLQLDGSQIDDAIAAGRRVLTLAADYGRDEEIGRSRTRLDDLYEKATAAQDIPTALNVVRETNRLMSLYETTVPVRQETESKVSAEAAAIKTHLVPLKLAPESAPLVEHCRLAALKLIQHLDV